MKLQLVAKYEKIEGGPFGNIKKFQKNFQEIFEQYHSAEKCKRGDRLAFVKLKLVAKYEKGGPFGAIQKVSKKGLKEGGSLVCFRCSGRLFVFFSFRFGCASEVRVF